MTGINRLNIFVNFPDKILPHVPTWRRNWSWFRCEPALFCFCSRSPGGFLGRKSTVSRLSFARAWRAGFFGAKVLLWADGKKRLRLMSLWCQRQLSAKFLRFFEKYRSCWTECKILTFRSHSPLKKRSNAVHLAMKTAENGALPFTCLFGSKLKGLNRSAGWICSVFGCCKAEKISRLQGRCGGGLRDSGFH